MKIPPTHRSVSATHAPAFPPVFRTLLQKLTLVAALSGALATAGHALATEKLPDTRIALEEPDRFSWMVFVELCKKAPPSLQTTVAVPGGGTDAQTNNAIWETWATDQHTFPANPVPNDPPTWHDRLTTKLLVTAGSGASGLEKFTRGRRLSGHATSAGLPSDPNLTVVGSGSNGAGTAEEVRRNEASFNYIIRNHLFYTQGLAKAWADRVNAAGYLTGTPIKFPTDAIEIKADWASFAANPNLTKKNCHWNYDEQGHLWGLIGLHIMTKALPNWTWATFEWVDNPTASWKAVGAVGRSDWIGTSDTFGYLYRDSAGKYRTFQAPVFLDAPKNTQPSYAQYSGGRISTALEELFTAMGYEGDWRTEWSHYRLKGSQVDFVDANGLPTLLGNSSTEAEVLVSSGASPNGNLTLSSCITCHAGANATQKGTADLSPNINFVIGPANPGLYFNIPANSGVGTAAPYYSPYLFTPTSNMGLRDGGYPVANIPLDFVWAFFNASPAAEPTATTAGPPAKAP